MSTKLVSGTVANPPAKSQKAQPVMPSEAMIASFWLHVDQSQVFGGLACFEPCLDIHAMKYLNPNAPMSKMALSKALSSTGREGFGPTRVQDYTTGYAFLEKHVPRDSKGEIQCPRNPVYAALFVSLCGGASNLERNRKTNPDLDALATKLGYLARTPKQGAGGKGQVGWAESMAKTAGKALDASIGYDEFLKEAKSAFKTALENAKKTGEDEDGLKDEDGAEFMEDDDDVDAIAPLNDDVPADVLARFTSSMDLGKMLANASKRLVKETDSHGKLRPAIAALRAGRSRPGGLSE